MKKAAIDGALVAAVEIKLPAQQDEILVHRFKRFAIVLTEIGDGLVIWRQTRQQPDDLKIALRFAGAIFADLKDLNRTVVGSSPGTSLYREALFFCFYVLLIGKPVSTLSGSTLIS